MFNAIDMIILVSVLLTLVFCGFHIAVSLGVTSLLGIYLINGDWETVRRFSASTAYEALRDYVFAVIPLFMLMGEFLAKCGAARDLFTLINRLTQWVPGRLGVATVLANAVSRLSPASRSPRRRRSRKSRTRKCAATATSANSRSAALPAAPAWAC